jgi:hypothetical protein
MAHSRAATLHSSRPSRQLGGETRLSSHGTRKRTEAAHVLPRGAVDSSAGREWLQCSRSAFAAVEMPSRDSTCPADADCGNPISIWVDPPAVWMAWVNAMRGKGVFLIQLINQLQAPAPHCVADIQVTEESTLSQWFLSPLRPQHGIVDACKQGSSTRIQHHRHRKLYPPHSCTSPPD